MSAERQAEEAAARAALRSVGPAMQRITVEAGVVVTLGRPALWEDVLAGIKAIAIVVPPLPDLPGYRCGLHPETWFQLRAELAKAGAVVALGDRGPNGGVLVRGVEFCPDRELAEGVIEIAQVVSTAIRGAAPHVAPSGADS